MRRIQIIAAFVSVFILAGCGNNESGNPASSPVTGPKAAGIERFEVLSTADAFNGVAPPGTAGTYQVITGIAHGRLNPADSSNTGIVDLNNAPRDADGYVAYSTDVVLLRPKDATKAKRILFYDVVNRCTKPALNTFL